MRSNLVVVALSHLLLISNPAAAQKDSVPVPARENSPARAWIIPVGIATSAAFDPEIREWALHTHSRSLDRLAKSVNPLGTTRILAPGIAITYVGALITHDESLATGTLNTAAAYIASDLVESLLKPVIGRERPHVEGDSHRFHLLTGNGDWHSFPSAHVTHITSIAQAISMQTQSGSVAALCTSLVALMAWDRVYEDQHWTSDVTATIALSSIVSSATVRWMESRRSHSR
ncbi:MAG TPA: phosphatase PAP2 family protein [Gemmatimonadaceae bacterium]